MPVTVNFISDLQRKHFCILNDFALTLRIVLCKYLFYVSNVSVYVGFIRFKLCQCPSKLNSIVSTCVFLLFLNFSL